MTIQHGINIEGESTVINFRKIVAFAFLAALAVTPAFASRTHRSHSSGHVRSVHSNGSNASSSSKAASRSHHLHGQQAIAPERVTQIQQALIREHYLTADANGRWDSTTEAAMQKFQADNGWQTKLMPDSRALVKLGLGPDYSNAINAKDASFAPAPVSSTIPRAQADAFADAAGVNH